MVFSLKKVGKIFIYFLVIFLGLLSSLMITVAISIIFRMRKFSSGSEWSVNTRKYTRYNSHTKQSSTNIMVFPENVLNDEPEYYTAENGDQILISNMETSHYKCTGRCKCVPERRSATVPLVRSFSFLVAAMTSFFAYKMAEDVLDELCYKYDEKGECIDDELEAMLDCDDLSAEDEKELEGVKYEDFDEVLREVAELEAQMEKEESASSSSIDQELEKEIKDLENEDVEFINEEEGYPEVETYEDDEADIKSLEGLTHGSEFHIYECTGKCVPTFFPKHVYPLMAVQHTPKEIDMMNKIAKEEDAMEDGHVKCSELDLVTRVYMPMETIDEPDPTENVINDYFMDAYLSPFCIELSVYTDYDSIKTQFPICNGFRETDDGKFENPTVRCEKRGPPSMDHLEDSEDDIHWFSDEDNKYEQEEERIRKEYEKSLEKEKERERE